VSEKFLQYAETVHARLREAGLRAELDTRDEKLGFKIREAQLQKVPYMLVVGAREEEQGTVAVRLRTEEDLGGMGVGELVARVKQKVAERSHEL
jgi:threonyl-tRNA synthetase